MATVLPPPHWAAGGEGSFRNYLYRTGNGLSRDAARKVGVARRMNANAENGCAGTRDFVRRDFDRFVFGRRRASSETRLPDGRRTGGADEYVGDRKSSEATTNGTIENADDLFIASDVRNVCSAVRIVPIIPRGRPMSEISFAPLFVLCTHTRRRVSRIYYLCT